MTSVNTIFTFRGKTVAPDGETPIGEGIWKPDHKEGGFLVTFRTGPDAGQTWQVNGKPSGVGTFDIRDYRYEVK